jgi:hypothetical protein
VYPSLSRITRLLVSLLLVPCAAVSQQNPVAVELPVAPRPTVELLASVGDDPIQSSSSSAQQTPATAQQAIPVTNDPSDSRAESDREVKQQESQRMLGIVPAFNEVIGGHAVPLRPSQKFSLFFHSAFDPYQFGIVALDAGIEQWEDQFPEYHFGAQGYGRRYAAAFADNFDGNFWGNAVLPSLLHQDPRYYRMGHGNVMHRILYSASTAVICKGDDGKWQPNISNVTGNIIGGAISNLYYPASDRGIGLTFERGLTVTATGSIGALAEEFYPDVAAYFSRRHARKVAEKAAAAQAAAAQPETH